MYITYIYIFEKFSESNCVIKFDFQSFITYLIYNIIIINNLGSELDLKKQVLKLQFLKVPNLKIETYNRIHIY